MPGLNQLKQFNKDILSLGDEPNVRASRGERPVRVPIPKSIEDRDDTEDFVLGMPEIEAVVEDTQVDDDLSEITGIGKPKSSDSSETAAPSFETPDLSNLLDLGANTDGDSGDMPDLSMFMEPVGEEEPEDIVEEEPEPEEVSVADMGLEALLSGAGFDGSEGTGDLEEGPKKSFSSDEYYDFDELDAMDEAPKSAPASNTKKAAGTDDLNDIDDLESFEDSLGDTSDFDADVLNIEKNSTPAKSAYDSEPDFDFSSLVGNDSKNDGIDNVEDLEQIEDLDELEDLEDLPAEDAAADALPSDDLTADDNFSAPSFDDLPGDSTGDNSFGTDDFSSEDIGSLDDIGDLPAFDDSDSSDSAVGLDSFDTGAADTLTDDAQPADVSPTEDLTSADNFSAPNLDDLLGGSADDTSSAAADDSFDAPSFDDLPGDTTSASSFGTDDFSTNGLDDLGELPAMDESSDSGAGVSADDNFSTEGLDSFDDLPLAEEAPSTDATSSSPADDFSSEDIGSLDDIGDLPAFDDSDSSDSAGGLDSFDTGAADTLTDDAQLTDVSPTEDLTSDDNFSAPNFDDLSGDSTEVASSPAADTSSAPSFDDLLGNSSDVDASNPFGTSDDSEDFASAAPEGLFNSSDMELPDLDIPDDSSSQATDNLFTSEIPDYDDGSDSTELEGEGVEGTLETFDTSDMDGDIDFGISDTDSALSGGHDFELGGADDFALEGSDFEIPGFSDVESIEEKKSTPAFGGAKGRGRGKGGLDAPDFSGAIESEKLPPNTLSDEQYKRFLKNLSEYPLNVRLAFEDFIVQDEFTDDAEFEVIEKILNKAPARQVASVLEKMLDISIPVPRDFEHRTAEEYEAYKKSIQYQLRNKIIPAMIVGVVMILVGWGLFNFGKYCIYIPAKAVSLYKQGYELIQKDEYPQSEQKFNEAVKYKLNKTWFFNYARAYREHKQYQRSSDMYTKILRNFKQDKQAGLEYADMMLNDLSNYERAEEILNREVLDYHINDADGRLLLGDTYLEWGTEKDPSKLDLAKEQYSILSQIYGANDLYNSRLMRYYVRSDNLLQVLNYKAIFEEREKSLSAQDCTEMSGYLLDKLYGPLSPSEEPLRTHIEGIKPLLIRAIKLDPDNAVGLYNLGKYYVNTNEIYYVESTLKDSVKKFSQAEVLKKRDIYKFIDAYRLLGENYIKTGDTMKAQEQYTNGITLYTTERDNSGFAGNLNIGKLYADLANLNYFVSGDYDLAKENYKHSIELGNDNPSIRYRIGYVNYRNKNYQEALGSFMKAGEANYKEDNLLLAMANTLSLRDDDYSAEGYYEQLLARMDDEIADKQMVFPQTSARDYDIVNTYLKASNNYGVTLHRLAKRTGNSTKNAQAIVQFQHSLRAWDALTRNQETLVRLEGTNLAQENIKYITHMYSDYEPAIYIDIPRTLTDGEGL